MEEFFLLFFLLFFVFYIETVFWVEASVAVVIAPPIPSPFPTPCESLSACRLAYFCPFPESEVERVFLYFFFCQSKVYPLSTVLVHLDCHKGTPFPRLFPLYLGKMLSDSVLERRSVNSEP